MILTIDPNFQQDIQVLPFSTHRGAVLVQQCCHFPSLGSCFWRISRLRSSLLPWRIPGYYSFTQYRWVKTETSKNPPSLLLFLFSKTRPLLTICLTGFAEATMHEVAKISRRKWSLGSPFSSFECIANDAFVHIIVTELATWPRENYLFVVLGNHLTV